MDTLKMKVVVLAGPMTEVEFSPGDTVLMILCEADLGGVPVPKTVRINGQTRQVDELLTEADQEAVAVVTQRVTNG